MAVFVGLGVHRAQITFDALDTNTGELATGRMRPGSRHALRLFLESVDGTDTRVVRGPSGSIAHITFRELPARGASCFGGTSATPQRGGPDRP
jgi:hypothetical protein